MKGPLRMVVTRCELQIQRRRSSTHGLKPVTPEHFHRVMSFSPCRQLIVRARGVSDGRRLFRVARVSLSFLCEASFSLWAASGSDASCRDVSLRAPLDSTRDAAHR